MSNHDYDRLHGIARDAIEYIGALLGSDGNTSMDLTRLRWNLSRLPQPSTDTADGVAPERRTLFLYTRNGEPRFDILLPSGEIEVALVFPTETARDRAVAHYESRGFRVVAEDTSPQPPDDPPCPFCEGLR